MYRKLSLILLAALIGTALSGCLRPDTDTPPVTPDTSAETVEETAAQTAPDTAVETEPVTEPETESETDPETEPQTEPAAEPETVPETEPVTEAETDPPLEIPASPSAEITVVDGITYINGVLIVNKTYSLPETYAPGMNAEAFDALCRMFSDAKSLGYALKVASSYRSYYDQRYIYNGYVSVNGQAAADRFSARPGHSEHQTGLAFDVDHPDSNMLLQSFGDSPVGIWIAENCHKYGFIIRYPEGKEHLTGYMYEPWHVRYLGVELATEVYESGLCLEEFFGITSVYS